MALWMYIFVIGMFGIAIIGTIWITLWTIQRGERAKASRAAEAEQRPNAEEVRG